MASKRNRKGRWMGGMMMGIRRSMCEREWGGVETEEEGYEGWMEGEVNWNGKKWSIVGVYVNGDLKGKLEKIKEVIERRGEEVGYVGGDMNVRTGNLGGWGGGDTREYRSGSRRSKDKKINNGGRMLVKELEEAGWAILNGNCERDEDGEYTWIGKSETVIDYVVTDGRGREEVERMEIGEKCDSDHFPVIVTIRGGEERVREGEGSRKKGKKKIKIAEWTEEEKRELRRKLEERRWGEGSIEEMIEEVKKVVKEIKEDIEKGTKRKRKRWGEWWDEECKGKKKEVRRALRAARKKKGTWEGYKAIKREYNRLCEEKKAEEIRRFEMEVEKAIEEGRVWEVINRERRSWKGINEEIGMEEWKEYFMGLLGGVDSRVIGEGRKREEREEDEGITLKEIEEVIRKLKRGKAAGEDEIENEVWKEGGEGMRRVAWNICNKVWRGEGWPEEWKEGLLAPIVKKGEGRKVEEYRGVTLMQTLYKVYAAVLTKRLEDEVEEKEMVPDNQTGFRRGMGTIDNIYVLNYLANRMLAEKGGKMVAFFVDLKAAFDSVNRKVLWEAMRKRGISEGLIERVKEIYKETVSRVRVGEKKSEKFWTARGVRQGCPLSPILFNLLLADLEEELRERWKGGVRLGPTKVFSLAYADDMVLLAEDEKGMKLIMGHMEEYIRKRELMINVSKSKMMVFRNKGGRGRKAERWRLGGEEVEEVKEFCYLGYWIQQNGRQGRQVNERVGKAGRVLGPVWGIGKRRFRKDWKRRVWLFDTLVWSVMSYGAEIWGWEEWQAMERMQERYMRWVLGVGRSVPGYMIREELKRSKMGLKAAKRAWKFEEKLRGGKGSSLARRCLEEMESRESRRTVSKWEEARREYRRVRGLDKRGEERAGGERAQESFEQVEEIERDRQGKERWEKIKKSRNRWYKGIMVEGIPEYLEKEWGEERWSRVARFRLGEGLRGEREWVREEERRCRKCRVKEETWQHVLEECVGEDGSYRSVWERACEVMDSSGAREEWMVNWEVEGRRVEEEEGREWGG